MNCRPRILLILLVMVASSAHAQLLDTLVQARPYQLHIRVRTGSNPPLLFEAGGGQDASQWDSIAAVVHQRLGATVITYDRAGFGQSSFDTTDYTIRREIQSLEIALQQLGYQHTRLVLVGHSLGAFYNWVYAVRHPRQVRGLVWLDPRLPSRADQRFAKAYFMGLNRADYEPDYLSLYYLLACMARTSAYVGRLVLPPNIPILDIMAERGPFEDALENDRFKADQRRFVRAHRNRRLLIATGSSHNIPRDRPALVIDQLVKCYKQHR